MRAPSTGASTLRACYAVARDLVDALRALPIQRSAPPGTSIEVITDLRDLSKHATAWDSAVFQSGQYRPQASFAYVASYLEHLRNPATGWACVLVTRGETLEAALPFLAVPLHAGGRSAVRLDAATLEADLVVRPGADAIIPSIVGGLARAVPHWVSLQFGELQACSPTLAHLDHRVGPFVLSSIGHSSYISLPGSHDDYLERLQRRFRINLRRQTRKLFALPGAAVEFIASDRASDDHLDAFIEVEASGWKGQSGNAIRRRAEMTAYYRAVTRRLAAAHVLEWSLLRACGQVIAVFLAVRMGRKLALDKIAYDASMREYAPGNVLMGLLIEHAIASGEIDEIDLLTDHPWNRHWAAEARETFDLALFRSSPATLLPWYLPAVARHRLRDSPLARRLRRPIATPGPAPRTDA